MAQGNSGGWRAGAAEVDVTPRTSQFLFGYPHVQRYSTGVHDPLLASALFLSNGLEEVVFVACDIILVPRSIIQRVRRRVAESTGMAGDAVVVTATHTHSGPITATMVSNAADPVIPRADNAYLCQLEDGLVRAAVEAYNAAEPAQLRSATADGSALGTNRRTPCGPSISEVPVLAAHALGTGKLLGVMCVVTMHPTVLHEDWPLVSGDFPGLARRWLQQEVTGRECPFIYHMGASGNQSPRHVIEGNTIDEAQRLGETLGRAVAEAIMRARPLETNTLSVTRTTLDLPLRSLPSVAEAASCLKHAKARLEALRDSGADRAATRTAECDVFGAEETLTLAEAKDNGALTEAARSCLPVEVQVVRIGDTPFVCWPGEVFVEFALAVRERYPAAQVITLANGDLQGYLVTQAAVDEGAYEAGNAIFASPEGGNILVEATLELLARESSASRSSEHEPCRTS